MTADERFLGEALKEAELAFEEGELPIGCVIVCEGEIIARAHNERERTNDPTAHAEVLALRRAAKVLNAWRLNGCTLYVTLEPCAMCAGAIVQARVKRLVYGTPDSAQGCAGGLYRLTEEPSFTHFTPADGGVREADCAALMERFFEKKRRK